MIIIIIISYGGSYYVFIKIKVYLVTFINMANVKLFWNDAKSYYKLIIVDKMCK